MTHARPLAVKALLSLALALAATGCAAPPVAAPPMSLGSPIEGLPAGSHRMPDGTTMLPDGSILKADGSLLKPDGTTVQRDPVTGELPGYAGVDGTATPSATDLDAPAKSYRLEVIPILRQHCASCHTAGGGGSKALTMFDAAGEPQYAAIKENIGRMLLEIQSGRMPKGKPNSLTKAEFDVLDLWGAAEMPDN